MLPPPAQGSTLADNWDYPPFSVLNAREGWWQDRKRAWLALGIESELGRGGELIPNGGGNIAVTDTTLRGGLTWGNDPKVTQKGLNFYRDATRRAAASCPQQTTATAKGATAGEGQSDE